MTEVPTAKRGRGRPSKYTTEELRQKECARVRTYYQIHKDEICQRKKDKRAQKRAEKLAQQKTTEQLQEELEQLRKQLQQFQIQQLSITV